MPELCLECLKILSKNYCRFFANKVDEHYASATPNSNERLLEHQKIIDLYQNGLISECGFREHFNFVEDDAEQ